MQIRENVAGQIAHRVDERERAQTVCVDVTVSCSVRELERERESGRERGRECGREREARERATFPPTLAPSCLPCVVSLKYVEFAYARTSATGMPDWETAISAPVPAFKTPCIWADRGRERGRECHTAAGADAK